jgi:aarF domain-containing kinase
MWRAATGPLVRRRLLVGTAVAGGGAVAAYAAASPDTSVRGLYRQGQFWGRVLPICADYYWQLGSRSPWVRYQAWRQGPRMATSQEDNDDDDLAKAQRARTLQALHARHAPRMLQVMLDLKGLYIKLGQVLSVTALPIPEAYRVRFRTLQSDVPGWEDFGVVEAVLRQEFQVDALDTIFSHIDKVPCGAASIGQAHRAVLKCSGGGQEVIVKVQYPDAAWQVPADIQCVGDLLKICVWAGVVDESASRLSFGEFARQFAAELDYEAERRNLHAIYTSSLDPTSPYAKWGVVVPRVHEDLCTHKVITMTYLPGPKLEEEARRQLEALGINTNQGIRSMVRRGTNPVELVNQGTGPEKQVAEQSWKATLSRTIGQVVGLNTALWAVRVARRILLWSRSLAVASIQVSAPLLPTSWEEWATANRTVAQQVARLALTESWIAALFDCHGHQIFELGLFNADPHPGNILVLDDGQGQPGTRLGLIDFGQCKRLTPSEQVRIAALILSVANQQTDEKVAAAFRRLGIQTKNDSTEFLAAFANLMFGPLQPRHLDHAWHKKLHQMDIVNYFPQELSMVYRTALLLRGLAISLQVNSSVSEHWRHHAQAVVDKHKDSRLDETEQVVTLSSPPPTSRQASSIAPLARTPSC